MSTTAVPVPTQSKLAKLETELVNVAKKVKDGLDVAGNDAVKVAAFLQANSARITQLASLAGPGAVSVTTVGEQLLSLAIDAVKKSDSASQANGLTVSLDQNAIAAVKALIQAIEKI